MSKPDLIERLRMPSVQDSITENYAEAANEIERLRDIARRVAELPYFKNAKIEVLVRDAKDALQGASIIPKDRQEMR